ncbi:MAG: hydroxymethylbilane synthase [Synergistaceae bacterium]|jgi:hydroxymethylbilane synthase|nr:hydroxymethylbilane synthase [Synergistaceae bacterium]
MKRLIRIGSRESVLAVAQARLIIDAIARSYPEMEVGLVTMKTSGDLNQTPFDRLRTPQDRFGAKGLFVKELEQALLDGKIDLAVHSLKDMPMEQDERLPLVAFCERGDPRDALVLPAGRSEPGVGAAGCSSARRRVQLEKIMPDRRVESVRGNVLTRLKKLDGGQYAFLVLAAVGLRRLGLDARISRVFAADEILPSAGQGILTCQGRSDGAYDFLDALRDPDATDCALAERAFVRVLGGGCTLPVAALAEVHGGELRLTGLYADEPRGIYRRGTLSGDRGDAVRLGENLALKLQSDEESDVGSLREKLTGLAAPARCLR